MLEMAIYNRHGGIVLFKRPEREYRQQNHKQQKYSLQTKITQPHQNQCRENKDSLVVNKVKFIAFMAGVVNCSAQTVSRTEFTTIL